MNCPLVSVVIPTHNRPQFLSRAIGSALQAAPDGDVEVIVVPNGPDGSWKIIAESFKHDKRVHWKPIATAHANAARNHGMALAQGEYIRFLDDDDYLLPEASRQPELIEHAYADICSGLLASVDHDGTPLGQLGFPDTQDFVCAAVGISSFTLPTGNLFKRSSLDGCSWDINVHRLQDNAWMMDLASVREWCWVHSRKQVGVWVQHNDQRTSNSGPFTDTAKQVVGRLDELHENLLHTHRLDPARQYAISNALWAYVHPGFPYHPLYWTRIAHRARMIDPQSKPSEPFFRSGPFRVVNPVLGEWLLLPVRKFTRAVRDARIRRYGTDHRRRL